MKSRFFAAFMAFSVLAAPLAAQAADESSTGTTRYFVQNTKSFWRNALHARNIFDTGFTADLSDLQVRLAKLAGLKPVVVKKFTILEDAPVDVTPSATPTPQTTPASSVSWGVRFVLGDHAAVQTSGGKGIKIAILDTGIDTGHPDLQGRVTKCTDYADVAVPFIDQECADDNGHGTHMAGIIAANGGDDGRGIWGLAPEAEILVYKVCNNEGLCLSDDIAKGLEGAVNDGADIVVLGLGGDADSSFVDDALTFADEHDVLVIAAAGNNGPYDDSVDWPARNPLTLSVGALSNDGTVAEFSSRGTNTTTKPYHVDEGDIELAAPGENIESTFKDDGYAILSGTSMAAPHVAGLAALIWRGTAEHPAQATRFLLHEMAKDIGVVGDDNGSGWGAPSY